MNRNNRTRWPLVALGALALGFAIGYTTTAHAAGPYCVPGYSCSTYDRELDRRDYERRMEQDRRSWEDHRDHLRDIQRQGEELRREQERDYRDRNYRYDR